PHSHTPKAKASASTSSARPVGRNTSGSANGTAARLPAVPGAYGDSPLPKPKARKPSTEPSATSRVRARSVMTKVAPARSQTGRHCMLCRAANHAAHPANDANGGQIDPGIPGKRLEVGSSRQHGKQLVIAAAAGLQAKTLDGIGDGTLQGG